MPATDYDIHYCNIKLADSSLWSHTQAQFPLPELMARVNCPGDRFPLPVNMGRVDRRAFTLAELTGHQHG